MALSKVQLTENLGGGRKNLIINGGSMPSELREVIQQELP